MAQKMEQSTAYSECIQSMNKMKKVLIILAILVVPCMAFGTLSETSITTGSGSNKIKIRFWPANYTNGGQDSNFDAEIAEWIGTTPEWSGRLFSNIFFGDMKERLDFVKVVSDSNELDGDNKAAIVAHFPDLAGDCQFNASGGTCAEIDVVVDSCSGSCEEEANQTYTN